MVKSLANVTVMVIIGFGAYVAGKHMAKKELSEEKKRSYNHGYSDGYKHCMELRLEVEDIDCEVEKTLKRIENNLKFGGI